jgi:Resolvase, N terminal domain
MKTPKFIAYYRVSTDHQGRSGLGLEAQRQAVCDFLTDWGELIESFTEVESGRKNDRPQLAAALDVCRRHKATLVIAKLDRFTANILPIIHDLQAQGITGSRALSRALNARGIQTANQRQWYPTTVKNLLQRTNGEKMYHPTTDAIRRQICPDMPRLPYPTTSRNR